MDGSCRGTRLKYFPCHVSCRVMRRCKCDKYDWKYPFENLFIWNYLDIRKIFTKSLPGLSVSTEETNYADSCYQSVASDTQASVLQLDGIIHYQLQELPGIITKAKARRIIFFFQTFIWVNLFPGCCQAQNVHQNAQERELRPRFHSSVSCVSVGGLGLKQSDNP